MCLNASCQSGLIKLRQCIGFGAAPMVVAAVASALRLVKGFVEGLKFFKENREFSFKVAAEFTRTNDPEAISAVLDSPARLQEKIPHVPLKGIEFLLKVEALRNPRAAGFDPTSVIDSSFLQELEKSGFTEALWKK